VRGLIGETWRLLRTHGPALVLVALVLLVPAELAVAYAAEDNESLGVAAAAGLTFIGYAWVYGALIATMSRRTRSPLEPYGRTVDRVPSLVLATFVTALVTVLGLLLLIIPGLLVYARWSAASPLIVIERQSPFEALETSNGLVRGRTWTVLGAIVVVFLLAFVAGLPLLLLAELTDPILLDGIGNALFGVVVNIPTAALAYAIFRQARAVSDAPPAHD
jgi:ABC-type sugar transport system permease subunit